MHSNEHYHFVTGRLAEKVVREVVGELARSLGFRYSIEVMPITVAALMTGRWLLRHLQIPAEATRLVLPGYLGGDLPEIQAAVPIPVTCGPKNIRQLPEFFGSSRASAEDYGRYDIEIIAEINHADRLSLDELIQRAVGLAERGADVIDLGCSPGHRWGAVGDATRELQRLGLRVSIDSFDPHEVREACRAGAELVLSVNSQNCELAKSWGCEVVAVPDTPDDLASLRQTVDCLDRHGVPYRIDPIVEPIGLGFAASLERYIQCRRNWPDVPMMMGIGNITELTDADSAGINVLLLGFCQELQIHSVLTTQVINWARDCVRECDLARRLVHFAARQGIPPKHLEPRLVMLRDPRVTEFSLDALAGIGAAIRDNNFRLFIADGQIHAMTRGLHVRGEDPFAVLQQLLDDPRCPPLDVQHAFYLGFEMCKALQALTLSKNYEQDESLQWGMLTRPEKHHRLSRGRKPPSAPEAKDR